MLTYLKLAPAAAFGIGIVFLSNGAEARCSSGEIANFLCNTGVINKQTANTADAVHAGMGRPLDHMANQAAGAAVDAFAPGAGRVVTQGLELRDQYNRGGFGGAPGSLPGPVSMSPTGPVGQPVVFGSYCSTPAGRFGPGPMNPIGSPCMTYGPLGNVPGTVTY